MNSKIFTQNEVIVIFTEAIAAELIRKGFNPIEKGKRHWEFIDSVLLRDIVDELLAALEDNSL